MAYGLEIYNNTLSEFRAAIAADKAANPSVYAPIIAARAADAVGVKTTRGLVLEAYNINPDAQIDPDEASIRYWMEAGIGPARYNFNLAVTQVNLSNQIAYFNNKEDRELENSTISPLTLNQGDIQDGVNSLNVFDSSGTNLTKFLLAISSDTGYYDVSGKTATIANSSTGTFPLDYRLYNSMEFNGTSNYIQAPKLAGLSLTGESYCIEFWVHGSSLGGSIISNLSPSGVNGDEQIGYHIYLSNGIIYWQIYRSSIVSQNITPFSGTLVANQWNHIICNSHLDKRTLYINGNPVTTSTTGVNKLTRIVSIRYTGNTRSGYEREVEVELDYGTHEGSPGRLDEVTFEGWRNQSSINARLSGSYRIYDRLWQNPKVYFQLNTNDSISGLTTSYLATNPIYLRNRVPTLFTNGYSYYAGDWTTWGSRKLVIAGSGSYIGKSSKYLVTTELRFTIDFYSSYNGPTTVRIKTCEISVGDCFIGQGDLVGSDRLVEGVRYYVAELDYLDGGFLGIAFSTIKGNTYPNVTFPSFKTWGGSVDLYTGISGYPAEYSGWLTAPPAPNRIPDAGNVTTVGRNYDNHQASLRTYFSGYISNLRIVKNTPVYVNYSYPYTITPPTIKLAATQNMWANGSGYQITGSDTGMLLNTYNSQLGTKDIIDTSSYAITLSGNLPKLTNIRPKYLGSKYFDGTSTYSQLYCNSNNQAQLTGDFTVEAWIYPMKYSADSIPLGIIGTQINTSSSTPVWNLNIGQNKYELSFTVNVAGGFIVNLVKDSRTTGAGVDLNTWHHVAVTGNTSSGIYNLWLNGTNIATNTNNTVSSLNTADNYLYMGKFTYASSSRFFKGYIASPRVVGKQIYYTGFAPSTRAPKVSRFQVRYAFAVTPDAELHPSETSCQYWMWRGFDTGKAKNFSTEDVTWNQVAIITKKKDSGTETFNYPLLIGKKVLISQILLNTPDTTQTYLAWTINKSTAATTGNITISGGTVDAVITVLMK